MRVFSILVAFSVVPSRLAARPKQVPQTLSGEIRLVSHQTALGMELKLVGASYMIYFEGRPHGLWHIPKEFRAARQQQALHVQAL
jgi:hypothetical protein